MLDNELRLSRGVLYTEREAIPVKRIGKGAFSVAMASVSPNPKTGERDVYLFSDDETSDKELMAMAYDADPRNPHLPKVEKLGHTHDKTVYVMPLYRAPFRKADSLAGWKDFVAIKKCWETARRTQGHKASGYDINFATVACARDAGVRKAMVDALENLMDTAANYGSEYTFEFAPRNLATDARGNLILLDVLYDREALMRLHAAKRRQTMYRNPSRPTARKRAAKPRGRRAIVARYR